MSFEDINLWFAKDSDEKIVTIDKINENNKHKEYTCPICNGKLVCKTGQIMRWHFAHRDKSKCNSETQVHFWIKNEIIKKGDKFKVKIGNEIKDFVCKEIFIEKEYETKFKVYKPDITVLTEDNQIIYFEVANTNKKKIEEYLDIWLELNNIVVEVETKNLINGNSVNEYKAVFYNNKCYHNNHITNKINKFIDGVKTTEDEENFSKLSWLWYECRKYKTTYNIETIYTIFESIEDNKLLRNIITFLNKNKCNNIINDYVNYKKNLINNLSNDLIVYNCTYDDYVQITVNNIKYLDDVLNDNNLLRYFYLKECKFYEIENNHSELNYITRAEKYLRDISLYFNNYDLLYIRIKKAERNNFTVNVFNAELLYDDNLKFKMFTDENIVCKELNNLNLIIKDKLELKKEKELKDGNIKKHFISIAKDFVKDYNTTISIALNSYYLENKIVYSFYNKILKKSKKLTIKDENIINQELKEFSFKYSEFLKNNYKKEHKKRIIKSYKENKLSDLWNRFRNEIYINNKLKKYKCETSYDVETRKFCINNNHFKVPYNVILNYDNKNIVNDYINNILQKSIYKPKHDKVKEYPNNISKDIYNSIKYIQAYYDNYYDKCKINIKTINEGSYLLVRCKKNKEVFNYKIKEYKNKILFIDKKQNISKENFKIEFKQIIENDIRNYLYK